jgi:DNA-binding transcriptional LysR family regulator
MVPSLHSILPAPVFLIITYCRYISVTHMETVKCLTFVNAKKKEILKFQPHLAMNDDAGLASASLAGTGIGDLPPLVQPELLREGKLVEVMPNWHFRIFHPWLVHLGNRCLAGLVRVFKEFATQIAPTLSGHFQLDGLL